MNAYYEKIEAPVDEEISMTLYVVYYGAVRGEGQTCRIIYKPIGVYENEDMAKAVVNAIKGGLI